MLLQISQSGPRGNEMRRSTWGSGGQSSRSHDAEVRSGGLAEASFWTPSVEKVFWLRLNLTVNAYRATLVENGHSF